MAKVHPNAGAAPIAGDRPKPSLSAGRKEMVLTVWKKSLLFNCKGFTVFDGNGDLVFRVDNYMEGNKGEILLMDAAGKPLLTIRRKRPSLGENWLVYDGESAANPRFSVRKHVGFLNGKFLAYVTSGNNKLAYEIEGSYAQRCVAVYDEKRRRVAEIRRKEAVGGMVFGPDVFRLIVEPEMEPAVAMALVILLDQMFGSPRRFSY